MNAPSPFAPRAYLNRQDIAAIFKVKPQWLKDHAEDLAALGFPKPVPWHAGKKLWDPLAIALWQNAQMPEAHQALLARLLAAGQAEIEAEADLERVKEKIAGLTEQGR